MQAGTFRQQETENRNGSSSNGIQANVPHLKNESENAKQQQPTHMINGTAQT